MAAHKHYIRFVARGLSRLAARDLPWVDIPYELPLGWQAASATLVRLRAKVAMGCITICWHACTIALGWRPTSAALGWRPLKYLPQVFASSIELGCPQSVQ